MKCNDCGAKVYTPSRRLDVCNPCYELRLDLLDAVRAGTVHPQEFYQLQKLLARGNGEAANATRRVLGLNGPEI